MILFNPGPFPILADSPPVSEVDGMCCVRDDPALLVACGLRLDGSRRFPYVPLSRTSLRISYLKVYAKV